MLSQRFARISWSAVQYWISQASVRQLDVLFRLLTLAQLEKKPTLKFRNLHDIAKQLELPGLINQNTFVALDRALRYWADRGIWDFSKFTITFNKPPYYKNLNVLFKVDLAHIDELKRLRSPQAIRFYCVRSADGDFLIRSRDWDLGRPVSGPKSSVQ